jgi:hypothetical protein
MDMPSIPGVPDGTLSCGNNTALDEIKTAAAEMKAKLAEGKAALAELSAKKDEALAKLDGLKAKVDDSVSNFQEDLAKLSTKFGVEYELAKVELSKKYDGVVDGLSDKLNSIPSLEDILTGKATLPDICKTVENIAVKINADGTKEKIIKAPAAATPNVKAEDPPKFEPTVVAVAEQPSVASPSGMSRTQVINAYVDNYENPLNSRIAGFWDSVIAAQEASIKESKALPEYTAVAAKIRSTGKKGGVLKSEGLLSTEEMMWLDEFSAKLDRKKIISATKVVYTDGLNSHLVYVMGIEKEDAWLAEYEVIKTALAGVDGSAAAFASALEFQIANKQYPIDYFKYINK